MTSWLAQCKLLCMGTLCGNLLDSPDLIPHRSIRIEASLVGHLTLGNDQEVGFSVSNVEDALQNTRKMDGCSITYYWLACLRCRRVSNIISRIMEGCPIRGWSMEGDKQNTRCMKVCLISCQQYRGASNHISGELGGVKYHTGRLGGWPMKYQPFG